jgi:hypothetical protein
MSGCENTELRAGENRISSLKRRMACDLHTSAFAKRETGLILNLARIPALKFVQNVAAARADKLNYSV